MSATDKAKHEADDVAGKVKEAAGDLTGDDRLAAEGSADQVEAKAKKAGDDARDLLEK